MIGLVAASLKCKGAWRPALALLASIESVAEWMGADLHAARGLCKQAEIKSLENLDASEICQRHAEV
jgi:hypothetical protein